MRGAIWYLSEGSLVHSGLIMFCAVMPTCYPNIVQLGCRLIAWWFYRPPW